ncbi:unnamed protein product [Cyprideis torosa]|uniref:Uncharacterized protein n=1 Tax=Cyprideis torosa TaxID=163714 RepID=A0A7R8ZRI0_9CRUS|nr:unnamed protein product [Cyprideis torosa]CAG0898977.1 unnamed protein product [Cyprideis torosa]
MRAQKRRFSEVAPSTSADIPAKVRKTVQTKRKGGCRQKGSTVRKSLNRAAKQKSEGGRDRVSKPKAKRSERIVKINNARTTRSSCKKSERGTKESANAEEKETPLRNSTSRKSEKKVDGNSKHKQKRTSKTSSEQKAGGVGTSSGEASTSKRKRAWYSTPVPVNVDFKKSNPALNSELAKFLIPERTAGVDVDKIDIEKAAVKGNIALVLKWLGLPRSNQIRMCSMKEKMAAHPSLLHVASRWRQFAVMDVLMECGWDINARDQQDRTPLICNLEGKLNASDEIIKHMITSFQKRGAELEPALPFAIFRNAALVIRLLLEAGADPNQLQQGRTSWQYSVDWTPDFDLLNRAELFLEMEADPRASSEVPFRSLDNPRSEPRIRKVFVFEGLVNRFYRLNTLCSHDLKRAMTICQKTFQRDLISPRRLTRLVNETLGCTALYSSPFQDRPWPEVRGRCGLLSLMFQTGFLHHVPVATQAIWFEEIATLFRRSSEATSGEASSENLQQCMKDVKEDAIGYLVQCLIDASPAQLSSADAWLNMPNIVNEAVFSLQHLSRRSFRSTLPKKTTWNEINFKLKTFLPRPIRSYLLDVWFIDDPTSQDLRKNRMEKATRKRHNEQEPEPSKLRKTSKKQLGIFLRSYFKRSEDIHWPIFRAVRRIMDRPSSRVLYPGSYCHVTASAVFSDVVYVDFDSKFKLFFEDPEVLNWIRTNKDYTEETQIKFLCQNFEIDLEDETDASFDLIILGPPFLRDLPSNTHSFDSRASLYEVARMLRLPMLNPLLKAVQNSDHAGVQTYLASIAKELQRTKEKFDFRYNRCDASRNVLSWDTLLHLAAERGDLQMVDILSRAGADINGRDAHNMIPMMRFLLGQRRPELDVGGLGVKFFLDRGSRIEGALHMAIFRNWRESFQVLLEAGANPNARHDGETPFAFCGDSLVEVSGTEDSLLVMTETLLKFGADPALPATTWGSGKTLFHFETVFKKCLMVRVKNYPFMDLLRRLHRRSIPKKNLVNLLKTSFNTCKAMDVYAWALLAFLFQCGIVLKCSEEEIKDFLLQLVRLSDGNHPSDGKPVWRPQRKGMRRTSLKSSAQGASSQMQAFRGNMAHFILDIWPWEIPRVGDSLPADIKRNAFTLQHIARVAIRRFTAHEELQRLNDELKPLVTDNMRAYVLGLWCSKS